MVSRHPSANQTPERLRSVSIERSHPDAALPMRNGFPQPLTSLIGRNDDTLAARALIESGVRLLTLTGPGGVGKTRLALHIGEAAAPLFADGVVFVPLAAITDPRLVLATIARALGLQETGSLSPGEMVADYLRKRRLLLLLDNFEQVRPAAADLALLLASGPGLAMLVTSRALLNIGGEQRFPVAPLALPELTPEERKTLGAAPLATIAASPAVQLFASRAKAVDPRFVLTDENAAAVGAICRRLDGLPLAIELAAARLRHFSPADLLSRLRSALPLLTDGPQDAPDRLRTMREAIAWGYDLLSPEEQTLFRRLAIFAAGFTLEAAEWVVGWRGGGVAGTSVPSQDPSGAQFSSQRPSDPATLSPSFTPSVLNLIASLADKSLLLVGEADKDTRFTMLETIREFGLEQLAVTGEAEAIAANHATWCVHLADRVRQAGGVSHGGGLALLEMEHPNLRAALTWYLERGETTAALHLAGQLAEFWMRHGHVAEGVGWLERVLAADEDEPTAARANALVGLNMLLWGRNEFVRAERLVAEAESVARAVGDAGTLAYARLHQGYVAAYQQNFELAEVRAEESLAAAKAIPQKFSLNGALWLQAVAALGRDENDRAADLYEHLLTAGEAEGDAISIANSHLGFATLAQRRGDFSSALARLVEAATVCRGYGDRDHVSLCLDQGAEVAFALGAVEPAVRLVAAAAAMRRTTGAALSARSVVGQYGGEQFLGEARAALGPGRFEAAWTSGAALSLDEAVAEVAALARAASTTDEQAAPAAHPLTARQREILRLLVDGLSDKEIAAALGITRRTAAYHVATIRAKLNAPSRTAAAAIAVRDRLI